MEIKFLGNNYEAPKCETLEMRLGSIICFSGTTSDGGYTDGDTYDDSIWN